MKNKLTIALASGNNHKIAELNKLLSEFGDSLQICGAETFGGMPDVDENADTFEGNALIKARALMEQSGQSSWILADDSGLEVNALNGAPGIYSARYAGVGSSDSDNVQKLLDELQQIPEAQRKARFVCVLVLLAQSGDYHTFRGECQGRILYHATGDTGFGYDPVFCPEGFSQSLAELGATVKDRISHRAMAINALKDFLKAQYLR